MPRLVLPIVAAMLALGPAAAGAVVNDPGRAQQWGLDRIRAETAWRAGTGTGIVVAVIDSGVDLDHEDLTGRLVPGWDFVDDDAVPQDDAGHGTHVAGIVAATAGNGRGVAGVAPDARIMPIRVLAKDARGGASGTLDDVLAGIRWAVDHGAHVVNLSLGEQTQALLGPSFAAAVRDAWAAGVIPVVAAGNQFITGSGFSDEPAVVVSATTANDGKPTYSSQVGQARWGMAAPGGETPTLGAEGAILSTYWQAGKRDQYAYLAGTSMAAPHVAGAAAVLRGLGLSPDETVRRLLASATDIGPAGRDSTFGAGRLDLAAAVGDLLPSPPAPTVTAAGDGPAVTAAPRPGPATSAPNRAPTTGAPAPTSDPAAAPGPGITPDPSIDPGDSDDRQRGVPVALPAPDDEGDGDDGAGRRGPVAALAAVLIAAVAAAGWRTRGVVD